MKHTASLLFISMGHLRSTGCLPTANADSSLVLKYQSIIQQYGLIIGPKISINQPIVQTLFLKYQSINRTRQWSYNITPSNHPIDHTCGLVIGKKISINQEYGHICSPKISINQPIVRTHQSLLVLKYQSINSTDTLLVLNYQSINEQCGLMISPKKSINQSIMSNRHFIGPKKSIMHTKLILKYQSIKSADSSLVQNYQFIQHQSIFFFFWGGGFNDDYKPKDILVYFNQIKTIQTIYLVTPPASWRPPPSPRTCWPPPAPGKARCIT